MAVLLPLIGYLLPGCFYLHRQEERSTVIPVVVNRPRNKCNLDLQFGHSAPDRPNIARIAADGVLNPGLGDRLGPESWKPPDPARTPQYTGLLQLR